jgi:hypothetical protein
MTKLSAEQIAGVIHYAVGNDPMGRSVYRLARPNTDGPIFIAIALAESSGETTNVGGPNNNGTYDYGLWQINSSHDALLKGGDWHNPTANFQMACSLYQGAGNKFTPWTTYNTGVYAVHLPAAQKAWGNPDDSAATHSTLKDTTNAVDAAAANAASIAALMSKLTQSATWVRVGTGAAGVVLVLVAVAALGRTHIPLPGPVGAAVKAVGVK